MYPIKVGTITWDGKLILDIFNVHFILQGVRAHRLVVHHLGPFRGYRISALVAAQKTLRDTRGLLLISLHDMSVTRQKLIPCGLKSHSLTDLKDSV